MEFWKGIIQLLEEKHLEWTLFTNGDTYDELFAREVLEAVGHGEKLPTPKDSVQLVQNISSFQGIIAGRMHSNIIAYSLGIPSVGMIWNQKLEFWGKKIKHPERFLSVEQMTPANAVNALFRALDEKPERLLGTRDVYKEISRFVKKYVTSRGVHKELPYRETLLAPALGGIEKRYRNTNSREAFEYSLKHGYINFEVDLRLTSDDILVCVNRWHKDTMKILNIPTNQEGYQKALSFEEFSNAQYYNRISTMNFEEFAQIVSREKQAVKIILGVGQPSKTNFDKISKQLLSAMERYSLDPSRFLIRLEREEDIAFFKSKGLPIEIVYYVVGGKFTQTDTMEERCRKAIALCKTEKIEYISMNGDFYTDEIAATMAKASLKLCLFSYVRTDKIMRAIENGVFYVGSHYYDVQYLERLTQ